MGNDSGHDLLNKHPGGPRPSQTLSRHRFQRNAAHESALQFRLGAYNGALWMDCFRQWLCRSTDNVRNNSEYQAQNRKIHDAASSE